MISNKLKLALQDSDLWFPNVTEISKRTGIPRKTTEYQIKQKRKKKEIKIKITVLSTAKEPKT